MSELFVQNVADTATDDTVKNVIANILHRPPITVSYLTPPVNFRIYLFPKKAFSARGKGGRNGILTIADVVVAERLLEFHGGSGVLFQGRRMLFRRNRTPPNDQIIQRVQNTPWRDPREEMEEREVLARNSAPIPISGVSFGKVFREEKVLQFSQEVEWNDASSVSLDQETQKLVIKADFQDLVDEGGLTTGLNDITPGGLTIDLTSLINSISLDGHVYRKSGISASWHKSRVVSLAALPSDPKGDKTRRVLVETSSPPEIEFFPKDTEKPSQRLASLFSPNTSSSHPAMAYVSTSFCLQFPDADAYETFLGRRKFLALPREVEEDYKLVAANFYSSSELEALDSLLVQMDYHLAFEIEKTVIKGILLPRQAIQLAPEFIRLAKKHKLSALPDLFQLFSSNYRPSHSKPRRRGKRAKRPPPKADISLMESLKLAEREFLDLKSRPRELLRSRTAGIYDSFRLILTPTSRILNGPLPDQSNRILREFQEHQECFLRVSFEDEHRSPLRGRRDVSISNLLNSRVKYALLSGVKAAGRMFEFLGYSMSGLHEHSVIFMSPFYHGGRKMTASLLRDALGDFTSIQRKPALLAARWAQAFSATYPSIALENATIRQIEDIGDFTDGAGKISVSLAKKAWARMRRGRSVSGVNFPSVYQFRLGGAKGVVSVDNTLHGDVICLRPSQTKFEASPSLTFDIATTSAKPIRTFLNRPMIMLLEHHGTSKLRIKELQDIAINSAKAALTSITSASSIFNHHGLGESFRLPSLFKNLHSILNLDFQAPSRAAVFRNELIDTVVKYGVLHVLRNIKHRCRIPTTFEESATLLGIPDEFECLMPGQIFATVKDEKSGVYRQIVGRVLVTRSPQIHPGDMQFAQAVRRPQLEHLINCIVFPSCGERSQPSSLSGGDLDGDIYNVIYDPQLFPQKSCQPGAYEAVPKRETKNPCTIEDVADFIIDYIEADLLGAIAITFLRISDLHGAETEDCMKLAELASQAADFQKTGNPVKFQDLPRPPRHEKPDFLSGEGTSLEGNENFYYSQKLLGDLFRRVPDDPEKVVPKLQDAPDHAVIIRSGIIRKGYEILGLPEVSFYPEEIPLEIFDQMEELLEAYCDQLGSIAQAHSLSTRKEAKVSEAEVVSGTIQTHWADHRKRRDAVASMNLQTRELTLAVRRAFQGDDDRFSSGFQADDENEEDEEDEEDEGGEFLNHRTCYIRAWAGWITAEESIRERTQTMPVGPGDHSFFGFESFRMIALGTMLDVLKKQMER